MGDKTKIEWTDATWNPITGCSVISPGCTNCYAMRLAGTRMKHHPSRAGLTVDSKAGPVWNGKVRINWDWLDQPTRWRRPRMIFVCAHGDLFHESVPDKWIDDVFAIMALSTQHTFQVLTKRAARMRKYVIDLRETGRWLIWKHPTLRHEIFDPSAQFDVMFRKVWLGVSAEDQERYNERWRDLRDTPAAVRYISYEPALGPLDLGEVQSDGFGNGPFVTPDWVIAGGESGPNRRGCEFEWFYSIRDQCKLAGVPFFMKQIDKVIQIPADLMIREMPR